jgi:KUP system potassium uptake protein
LVNWSLAVGTLAAVLLFGSSDALGGAYGIAVSMLMAVITVLAALIAVKWGYNPLLVVAVNGFFLFIELVFVSREYDEAVPGRLVPALTGRRHCVSDADLAQWMAVARTGALQAAPARGRVR